MLLVDHSRTDATTNGPRSLVTEVWYPATDDSRDLPKNKFSDFFLNGSNPKLNGAIMLAFNIDLKQMDSTFKNFAVRDARVRDGVFPLIVFSHGNGGIRSQNTFWCEHMASHGYFVMSPDHTGNSAVTAIDGDVIVYNKQGRSAAALDRPRDLMFLIDAMTRMNAGADSRFLGKVNLEHIGASGHSFGGYAAAAVADADPRIDAIAPMAAVGRERKNYTCPAMVLLGTEDATIKLEGNAQIRKYYEESKGPHYLVEIVKGGHYSFTEMYQINPNFGDGVGTGKRITNGEEITYTPRDRAFEIINSYTTAFLGRHLKGLTGYDEYLATNHYPDDIIYKVGLPVEPAETPSAP
jgi:dienelactone hydrolase